MTELMFAKATSLLAHFEQCLGISIISWSDLLFPSFILKAFSFQHPDPHYLLAAPWAPVWTAPPSILTAYLLTTDQPGRALHQCQLFCEYLLKYLMGNKPNLTLRIPMSTLLYFSPVLIITWHARYSVWYVFTHVCMYGYACMCGGVFPHIFETESLTDIELPK